MNAPQIIMIVLLAFSVGSVMSKHGQPETGKHNAWVSLVGAGIQAGLLWWGGFWL